MAKSTCGPGRAVRMGGEEWDIRDSPIVRVGRRRGASRFGCFSARLLVSTWAMTFTKWIQVFRGFQRFFSVINFAYPLIYGQGAIRK